MTNPKDVDKMVKKTIKNFKRIDILINNAGRGYDSPIENTNIQTMRKIFQLDVIGPLIAMKKSNTYYEKAKKWLHFKCQFRYGIDASSQYGDIFSFKTCAFQYQFNCKRRIEKNGIGVSVIYPYITLTNFEKNTIVEKGTKWESDGRSIRPPDSAEFVAKKYLKESKKETRKFTPTIG